jgi:3',5'-cyclic AMP phosphodiesterase CpdA
MKNPAASEKHVGSAAAATRRRALGGFGSLLALGAWPASLAAAGKSGPPACRPIRFVVANDLHHQNAGCDPWMEALFRSIATAKGAEFCLGLGDLADQGKRESLETIKRLSGLAGMPFHVVPGNHDLDESPVEGFYAEVFPGQRNQVLRYGGWQVVLIDSTEGNKWQDVTISATTLAWLDETLPALDPLAPTVLGTHFPLAAGVKMCPRNADAVLARFIGHNLRGVFGGHFHGRTSSPRGDIRLVTNACVSRVRDNHDKTPEKGYLVVDGDAAGVLAVEFVEFRMNG